MVRYWFNCECMDSDLQNGIRPQHIYSGAHAICSNLYFLIPNYHITLKIDCTVFCVNCILMLDFSKQNAIFLNNALPITYALANTELIDAQEMIMWRL